MTLEDEMREEIMFKEGQICYTLAGCLVQVVSSSESESEARYIDPDYHYGYGVGTIGKFPNHALRKHQPYDASRERNNAHKDKVIEAYRRLLIYAGNQLEVIADSSMTHSEKRGAIRLLRDFLHTRASWRGSAEGAVANDLPSGDSDIPF